jgi:hypothetical protein
MNRGQANAPDLWSGKVIEQFLSRFSRTGDTRDFSVTKPHDRSDRFVLKVVNP